MRWRYVFYLLVVAAATLAGGIMRYLSAPLPTSPPSRRYVPASTGTRLSNAASASAVIDEIEKTRSYWLGSPDAISKLVSETQFEPEQLLRLCIDLLQNGSIAERQKAARFLSSWGKPESILPLVRILSDPQADVREEACYALYRLNAKGETVESELVKVCRNDSSLGVRVAAAIALDRSHKEDAAIALKHGLNSKDGWLWQICEDALDRLEMLELPLPQHIYTEISEQRYQKIKAEGLYWIKRETTHTDTIYLEVENVPQHPPERAIRQWCKIKIVKKGK